jgi:uncharacterized membrane protein YjjP (DUF1212 family)
MADPRDDPDYLEKRAFLIRCAQLLHAHGTPAHRLERVMGNMGQAIGMRASFLYTPTSVFASFGELPANDVHMVRVEVGSLDLGKLLEFDEVMEAVEDEDLSIADAYVRLNEIAAAPPRWNGFCKALAFGLASGGAARLFGGGYAEMGLAFLIGPILFLMARFLSSSTSEHGLFEPLAAFSAALLALLATLLLPGLDDRIVTLAALIVLIPGLSMTIGMTELATRHLVSGVARLAGSATVFLTILLGVAFAWRLGDWGIAKWGTPGEPSIPMPSAWSEWAALACAPFAFAVVLEARGRELGIIYLTAISGFLTVRFAGPLMGDLAPLMGALVVGVCSNAYARICNRPALVPLTPGMLLLVPGAMGYRSLVSFLDREALDGMQVAFQMGMVAVALVGGTLAANVILPPRRVM